MAGRRRKKPKTAQVLHRHFAMRWTQRVGECPPIADIEHAIRSDHRTIAMPVHRQSHTRTHYLYMHQGQPWRVIWDKKRKAVVTVLPPEATHEQGCDMIKVGVFL